MSSRSQGKSSAPPSSSLPMNYEAANSRLLNRRTPMPPIESDTPNHKPAMLPPGANLSGANMKPGALSARSLGGTSDDMSSPPGPLPAPAPEHLQSSRLYGPPQRRTQPLELLAAQPHLPYNPPIKRRRAKRTEEERIDYLRSDPQVAEFEPYRVLCAGCNKWIRLRPNSTYCSIPWDAHRKICLEKRM
ncbi:hypothetical protein MSAN_02519800 [Mycena sanguinolenta]|uniref:Uncharacterized protein n=1 Tax=Mycena sanguinolenta TaxID=230812 RepID=A0A8H6TX39_9AGAR|nr:hypothetical protein MSAN_02519800 [Mycena sanguinolenta]